MAFLKETEVGILNYKKQHPTHSIFPDSTVIPLHQ
jgi:hypothetical protein